MHELIIDAIAWGGYFGIFLLMVLENVVPPIPSEVIMGVGGVLVARGEMQFWPLLIIGTIGTTIGNWAWFWVGSKYGFERLEPFIDRWGRWLTIEWHDVAKATIFFQRHGHWVVFALRFSPFMRTMISLPAGLAHMPLRKFLFFTFIGSLIWNAMLILGGSLLAEYMTQIQGWLTWLVISGAIIFVVFYIWRVITWKPRSKRG